MDYFLKKGQNKLHYILLIFLFGCADKERITVNYPFLEISSFESLESINTKVIRLTGEKVDIVDDMGDKSCNFDYLYKDSIFTHVFIQFNNGDELIWFQCWYESKTKDLKFIQEWYKEYYQTDTIKINKSNKVIELKLENQLLHFQRITEKSEVLYFGQFFTTNIPDFGDI